jgi:pimeloyl-ACP methyl ester carboxylesterase/predicted glycosyltransferase
MVVPFYRAGVFRPAQRGTGHCSFVATGLQWERAQFGSATSTRRPAMRARYPDLTGFVVRDGVKVAYEVFGGGSVTVLLLPSWSIVHSRIWKMQVPYLARHARVITFDGRGNGLSDRPRDTAAYASKEFVADALAVLDAVGVDDAVVVGASMGAGYGLELASTAPDRVAALFLLGPTVACLDGADAAPPQSEAETATQAPNTRPVEEPAPGFHDRPKEPEGWALYNAQVWRERFPDFLHFFFRQVFSEPHSTKPIEDATGWALETDGQTLVIAEDSTYGASDQTALRGMLSRVRCPTVIVHGSDDHIIPLATGEALAKAMAAELLVIEDGGHSAQVKDPVAVNLALRRLLGSIADPPVRTVRRARALHRPRRVLYLSSPIGLGHARRDVAIADALRQLHPDVQVDWLAQHPLTELLERRGERIHPASAYLASESAHLESESAEHDLHAFQTIRRMDEILLNNFMVFTELVQEQPYDAWIGDEAWELDHFLHENPELKRAPYVWLTDFVGWLPMPDGGDPEAALAADYNGEMVEHIARYPYVRDRALFVGNRDDIVPDRLGPALPGIAEWTQEHFHFVGYVTGFDPSEVADPVAVRAELGYRDDEQICVVTVGGSGVGADLLRRVIAAYPAAKRLVPQLRMIVVAGPRIHPSSLPRHPGLEIRAYVHDLYRHLAVCDLAIVQGGLTTTMELTANRRPFLYVPLRHHFEQNFHVRHRLDRYGAGRCVNYEEIEPDALAAIIAAEVGRAVDYRPVETDGARLAAERIAELL